MALALAVWTVLIWIGRIRNIAAADGSSAMSFVVPVLLVALGVATIVRRRWGPLLALTTIAVWVVRVPLVLVHHHAAGFVAVHLVLAAVSIALAVTTVRARHPVPA